MKRILIICLFIMFLFSSIPISAFADTACPNCDGKGFTYGSSVELCHSCHGSGYTGDYYHMIFCGECNGSGYVKSKIYCSLCDGNGTIDFLVTYDANGGSRAPSPQAKNQGENLRLSSYIPIRDGYIFMGWTITPSGEVIYLPQSIYSEDVDITLYAVWSLACTKCNGKGEVEKSQKCSTCKGEFYFDGNVNCNYCNGTGINMQITTSKCPRCLGGTQGIIDKSCYICEGNGYIHSSNGIICTNCLGKGKVTEKIYCSDCIEGKMYYYESCAVCSGSGKACFNGHTEIIDSAVSATCEKTGLTQGSHCSVCNEVLVKQDIIPTTGHTEIVDKAVVSTCTKDGLTEGKHCSVCNKVLVKQQTISAKGHTASSIWTTTKQPGCINAGTKVKYCTICQATVATETISAKGHDYGAWTVTKSATCTATGTQTRKCSTCGAIETQTIAKTAHNYTSTIVAPTCSAQGYTLHTCSKCSTSYKDAYTNAKGHGYGSWTTTKAATCTTDGIKTRKCSKCGKTEAQTIGKTGHSYTTKVVAPTCTAQGYTLHTCSRCGDSYKDSETTMVAHKYTTTAVKPTYAAQGYTLHKCSLCGTSYKDNYKAKLSLANITKVNFKSSANAVKMSWNKVSGATGYRVYKYNTSTKKWQGVANIKGTSYTFGKLKAGTTYKFTVRAYKTVSGKTYLSPKYKTFTSSTNPATVSFKVTGGTRKAVVKWNKVTGATGYKVYYKTSKNGKWVGLKTTNNKTTSYTKTGLATGKTYYFTVKAYRNANGKTYNGAYNSKRVKVK